MAEEKAVQEVVVEMARVVAAEKARAMAVGGWDPAVRVVAELVVVALGQVAVEERARVMEVAGWAVVVTAAVP